MLGRTDLDFENFYFLDFFWDSKLPDFHVPRNLARARRGPGWAGLGPGPSGGREGFFGWAG